ncbi:helix-turn-helix domain-containing protein [Actinosynnema sp. NPDC020468]|uniref:TetR/AcrR family transcriptional regulator n=1 Tax=Actinosynnema sp. NPDC020468 TaxID=3154488 RepID=UPI0033EDF48B
MSGDPPRPRGRPRTLSRDAVVEAARRVADEEGLAELTLRRVARELGTGQASLYRHIADRGQLLGLLAEGLAAGYPLIAPDGADPVDGVVRQWQSMRAYLVAHPWGPQVIAGGEFALDAARPVAEHCVAGLRATGLADDDAVRAYRSLWHLLLGHLLNAHPFGHLHGSGPAGDDFAWAVRALVLGAVESTVDG